MQFGVNAHLAGSPPVVFLWPAWLNVASAQAPSSHGIGAGARARPRVFPNPYRPGLDDRVSLTRFPSGIRLAIYDVSGTLVRELVSDGSGAASWDGGDRSGRPVASGVYLVRICGENAQGSERRNVKVIVRR
jgi:hypothetical protein